MTLKLDAKPEVRRTGQPPAPVAGLRKFIEQVMAIVGAIALFLGVFIANGGENQRLELGGWSWWVGDIDTVWMYGLLIGGTLLIIGSLALIWQQIRTHR